MTHRLALVTGFALLVAYAAFQEPGPPSFSATLEVTVEPLMPVRVYLFKGETPFRLHPVGAVLPIRTDLFYRDRLWTETADPAVLEVIASDQSHFFLLKGKAVFHLPPGSYRMEAYRGLFYTPALARFELKPGETHRLTLPMKTWAPREEWISGDDHIHLTRSPRENAVYLGWLEAEDLNVGNFLQLQRQMDAGVQYAFGKAGEARRPRYSIRPGQESRNEFWGHINMLGVSELIRPLSTGAMYANSPESYPFPALLFAAGRKAGATVGHAHFFQSPQRSTLLMDLALGAIDFVEVFQFGQLKIDPWYELLNAGLRVTGIACSDFPVPLNNRKPWPRWLPLLGPERALVKARAGEDPYQAWAAGVRSGNVVVSNGPLVELSFDAASGTARATASFHRPLESLEVVRNGRVVMAVPGDGILTSLTASVAVDRGESCWVAARTRARSLEGEPEIRAHTSPVYHTRDGKPVALRAARQALADRWQAELESYRRAGIVFPGAPQREEFFTQAERALAELRRLE